MSASESPSKRQLQSHEQKVFRCSSLLLDTLAKDTGCSFIDKLKSVGFFLASIGESIQKDSWKVARQMELEGKTSGATTLGVALCIHGDQIMDYATALYIKGKAAR